MKLAYADRSEYLGDPDFVKIPLKGLTSKRYAEALAKASTPTAPPGQGDQARPAPAV
jgi:gamma-glutamyltranspeptidase/glutathione hydrolase